jgi:hypothetical protein
MAYWPVLDAHPLMDDHLFFSWLEQTPSRTALWQRFSGNWIPYFNQIQMYRPVSGGLQVLIYKLSGPSAAAPSFSLLLHALAGLWPEDWPPVVARFKGWLVCCRHPAASSAGCAGSVPDL